MSFSGYRKNSKKRTVDDDELWYVQARSSTVFIH